MAYVHPFATKCKIEEMGSKCPKPGFLSSSGHMTASLLPILQKLNCLMGLWRFWRVCGMRKRQEARDRMHSMAYFPVYLVDFQVEFHWEVSALLTPFLRHREGLVHSHRERVLAVWSNTEWQTSPSAHKPLAFVWIEGHATGHIHLATNWSLLKRSISSVTPWSKPSRVFSASFIFRVFFYHRGALTTIWTFLLFSFFEWQFF